MIATTAAANVVARVNDSDWALQRTATFRETVARLLS